MSQDPGDSRVVWGTNLLNKLWENPPRGPCVVSWVGEIVGQQGFYGYPDQGIGSERGAGVFVLGQGGISMHHIQRTPLRV